MSKLNATEHSARYHFMNGDYIASNEHEQFLLVLDDLGGRDKFVTIEVSFGDRVVASWIADRQQSQWNNEDYWADAEATFWLQDRLGMLPADAVRVWGSSRLRENYTGDLTPFGL